jgi:hypothetical protein
MRRVFTFLIGTVIAALALVTATTLYGLTMPREHLFLRRMSLAQPPAEVWRVVTDYGRQPEWHPGLVRAERVPAGAVGPLAGALAGARSAAARVEERSRGDAATQQVLPGDGGAVENPPASPPPEEKPVWRFVDEHGASILMQVGREQPPRRLIRHFRDEQGRYEASWDLEIEAHEGGSQIMLTERGRIANPLRRAVTRLLVGQDRQALQYLRGLAARFGEEGEVRRVPREYVKPLE